jgi:hypothetical protein
LVSPVTRIGGNTRERLAVTPPFEDTHVAVKVVMNDPPLTGGPPHVNATDAEALPEVAEPMVGGPGTVAAETGFDAADAPP